MKKGLVFFTALLFGTFCMAQTGQTLEPGQSMTIDVKGNIVTSATFSQINNEGKIMKEEPVSDIRDIKYNPDGTFKIPGYTPTGDPETDQELYKKAKYLLYQNNIEEYNRIFNQPEIRPTRKNIPYEEFETYPENKRQHILSNPDKYIVVFPVEHDCK